MKAPCAGMQGKMLPSVTEEDNGDVLTVVGGEWKKAEASGGGGVLVVNGVPDEQGDTVTLDKTWQEIFDAPFAVLRPTSEGNTPVFISREFTASDVYTVTFLNLVDEGKYIDFICNTADGYPIATFT